MIEDTHSTDEESEPDVPQPESVKKPKPTRTGSVIGAAMLGLGEVLEPEKTQTDVVVQASLDDDDDLGKKFDLDFGQLEDLEPPS